MSRRWIVILPVLMLSSLLSACDGGEEPRAAVSRAQPLVAMDTGTVRIAAAEDTFAVRVEIAETSRQTQLGLMYRDTLPEDEGMIFLFSEPRESGFWMYQTRIPLDIAYLDEEGRIVSIHQMEPCREANPEFCPSYPPGAPYVAALEVGRGYFAARGIGQGDLMMLVREEEVWPEEAGAAAEASGER